jgi:ferredoxin
MRVVIDPDRCQGMGECSDIVPGLIEYDVLGIARVVAEPVEVEPDALRRLVAVCPSRAITLQGD